MILHICDLPSCVYSLSLPSNISGCWKNIAKPPEKTFPASQMSQEALQPTMASCPNSATVFHNKHGKMEQVWSDGVQSGHLEAWWCFSDQWNTVPQRAEMFLVSATEMCWNRYHQLTLIPPCPSVQLPLLPPCSIIRLSLMLSMTFPLLPTQCQSSLFSPSSIGWENVYCLYRNAQNLTFAQVSHLSPKMYSNHAHLQLGHYIYLVSWYLAVE